MMEDELVKIWQSSPNQERIKFEKSRLMLDVQKEIDRLDRMIKYRDIWETGSVAVVVPAFAVIAWWIPFTWSKIGSVLIVLWAIYVVIRLRNAKKHKPGAFTENYLDYLRKNREYLTVQKGLLDTVLYWYLLPCFVGATLFLIGIVLDSKNLRIFIKMEILGIAMSVGIYIANKRAAKKLFTPRLAKIEELIKVLEKS